MAKGAEVDEALSLLERGRLALTDGVAVEDFVAAGGKVPMVSTRPETITARRLVDHYLATIGDGTVEESSLGTARTHLNQFIGTVGERYRMQSLIQLDLQGHLDRRRKKGVAAVTLKKEMASIRACWNCAANAGLVKGPFPGRGSRFPKEQEKEPFRSYAEIEAMFGNAQADDGRSDALWEALYLTRTEIEELQQYVREHATQPWVHPMMAFAAYTGARRSEMLRALVGDVHLAGGTVTIREKKRLNGKRSKRTAPVTPRLAEALKGWINVRPPTALTCSARQPA